MSAVPNTVRVLHVVPALTLQIGGPAASVVGACRALEDVGVETTIFTTDIAGTAAAPEGRMTAGDLPEDAAALDVRFFPVRPPHRLVFSPSLYRELGARVSDYDLVHIHSLFLFPQFAAYRQAERNAVPYVVAPRGTLQPWLRSKGRTRKAINDRLWQRRMLEHARALHVTAADEGRLLADIAPAVPRIVVPNGIDSERFRALPERRFRDKFLDGDSSPIVLFLGRLSYKKGLDVLIEGFAHASDRHRDAILVIAGPDHENLRPTLEEQARRLGVGDRVKFTGFLAGEDKLAALAAARVFALTSHSENFAVALVEAMAAGCASIVSREVNIAPEIEGENAAVVIEPVVDQTEQALSRLLDDPDLCERLGDRARAFAARYDWSTVGPQLKQAYRELLEQGRGGSRERLR